VPRRINLLCDRALLGAYATGRRTVDAGIVGRAAAEVDGEPLPTDVSWWGSAGSLRRTAWLAAAGFVLSLAGAGLASWLMRQA
jgi:general secretion pathway protein A